ncbi:MAG: VIT domain-containing protein [Phycisphaerales bacterium]
MKKKIVIASTLLGLTAVAFVGHFVGCRRPATTSLEQTVDRSRETSALPDEGQEGVARTELMDRSQFALAEPTDAPPKPQKKDVVLEYESEARMRQVVSGEDKKVLDDGQPRSDVSVAPRAVEVTKTMPVNLREFDAAREREGEEAHVRFSRGPSAKVPVLGDKPIVGGLYGDGHKQRNRKLDPTWQQAEEGRYGWDVGVQPTDPKAPAIRTTASRGQEVTRLGRQRSTESELVSARRIPAELVHVSADEIWVIAKHETQAVPVPADDDTPGCGAMLARRPKEDKEIPLPLKHTDVKGQISGYIATVDVTQQFHNPYDEKIEAVYVFPLPQNAAINEFIMTIGERRIRGIIRERKEAERIYQQAKSQGHVASLLTQERPNIFTQKVANIEPGKEIDVNIKYFNTLAYVDGWYEFVFPMVVGPRFNPPGFTEGVGAVARGKPGISGQQTEVQYLKPGERSGHDISLAVDIDAGVAIEQVVCSSHVVSNSSAAREKRTVKLSSLDSIPNKDFVLRYKVAGKTVKSALVTHRDERGGFFTLMLYPPENLSHLKRAPMEMIFVLDCSGSMSGKPIAKAKQAITRALRKLQPNDTFQVIRFSNNASQLGPSPLPATPANIRRGLEYVKSLRGSGGTMMIEGIKAALDFAHDPHRFRLVSFMTDGYIGNEAQILAAVHQRLGASRIFSFGVGTSVNRYLLDRMAKLGKGAVAYIGLDDSAGQVVDLFYERISHPALTDVTIDWGDMQVTDAYPQRIPDLFVGRPVIVTGRFNGRGSTTVRVAGKVGDLTQEIAIPVNLDDSAATHPGIACVWARKRIETLGNQATYDTDPDLPGQIKQVALEYGLMSAYTAFIAVDSSRKTAGDHGITVAVPVPVPDGVRYETTVQN